MTIVTPLTLSLIKSRTGRESRALRAGLSLLFIIDIAFLLANLTKLEDGGWLPLVSGLIIYWLMQTWQTGGRRSWRGCCANRSRCAISSMT
jgi:K+ transporter